MGSIAEHIAQSKYNEESLDFLIKNHNEAVDWIITITFYYALHIVQAKLQRDFKIDPKFHNHPKKPQLSRNKCAFENLPLNISIIYNNLYNESMKARYTEYGVYRDYESYKKMEPLVLRVKNEFPKLLS